MPTAYENDLRSPDASLGAPAGRPDTVTAGKDDDPVLVHGVDASILTRGRLTSHTHQCLPSCRRCRPGSRAAAARVAAWTDTPAPPRGSPRRAHTAATKQDTIPHRPGGGRRARRCLKRSLRRVPGACYRPRSRMDGWTRTKRVRTSQASKPRHFRRVRCVPTGRSMPLQQHVSIASPFFLFEMGVIHLLRKN